MSEKKKIILFTNFESDVSFETTRKVAEILTGRGREVVFCPLQSEEQLWPVACGLENLPSGKAEDFIESAEMIISFGGDGTILRAARIAANAGFATPILGINAGRKGFMAELEATETELIESAACGEYKIESRMMLDVEVIRDGKAIIHDFALNDIVVKGDNKVIDLTILGDGQHLSGFSGDGVVIATPTGSTAYSMSAGGPIVEPSAHSIIVTPLCAHLLEARSFVLASDRLVTLKLGSRNRNQAYLSSDGGDHFTVGSGDIFNVKKSAILTNFVRLTDRSFYKKVSVKLGGQG